MRNLRLLLAFCVLLICTLAGGAQLRQVGIIDMPGPPGFDAAAFAAGKLVLAHTRAGTLDIFDPAKRRTIAQVKGLELPHGLAVDEQAGRIFAACAGSHSIAVVSAADWSISGNIELPADPDSLLFVPLTRTLFAASSHSDAVLAIDPSSHATRTAAVPGSPQQLAWDAEKNQLYVTIEARNAVEVLTPELKPARTLELQGSMPTGIAFDPKMRHLFVAVRYAVLVLEADSGHEIARIPAPAGVDQVWFDDFTRSAYAASSGGTVTMIGQENGRYTAQQELNTAVRGHNLAFDPARSLLFVPGGFEGRSKLVILKRLETPPPTAKAALR
ncbi:MAG: YncE family protein [Acidobacteria bacterium]|nr:YncE family protein [Acidobacteriota bacterium]